MDAHLHAFRLQRLHQIHQPRLVNRVVGVPPMQVPCQKIVAGAHASLGLPLDQGWNLVQGVSPMEGHPQGHSRLLQAQRGALGLQSRDGSVLRQASHAVEAADREVVHVVRLDDEVTHRCDRACRFDGRPGDQPAQRARQKLHRHRRVRHAHVQVVPAHIGVSKSGPADGISSPHTVFVRARDPFENLAQPVGFLPRRGGIIENRPFPVALVFLRRRRRVVRGAGPIKIAQHQAWLGPPPSVARRVADPGVGTLGALDGLMPVEGAEQTEGIAQARAVHRRLFGRAIQEDSHVFNLIVRASTVDIAV